MTKSRHYEESAVIPSTPAEVFSYVDDHSRLSSHMNKSSWMMAGGKMDTQMDEGKGQKVGSHIRMGGKIFGIHLFLDEVIIEHNPPRRKVWKTVGNPKLLVIGHYQMGIEIHPRDKQSHFKVFIDYELPGGGTGWMGYLFGDMYAKWCVRQMLDSVRSHFNAKFK